MLYMEDMEKNFLVEWRIENLSHWCSEVHGECIQSPQFTIDGWMEKRMELYPKGIDGREEYLVVRFRSVYPNFSGDLCVYSSDGSLLLTQLVKAKETSARPGDDGWIKTDRELPTGLKFEDVLSRIRENDSSITLKFRMKYFRCYEQRLCTTINVFKTSLNINPSWIEKMMASDESNEVCFIQLSPDDYFEGMWIEACSKNNTVQFTMTQTMKSETPIAVDICMLLKRSDGTVDSCVKKEHVFRDNKTLTFPDSLERKELIGKGIFLTLCLKTRNLIKSPYLLNHDHSSVSIESSNNPRKHDHK